MTRRRGRLSRLFNRQETAEASINEKRESNAALHVSRLPPELLSRIFVQLRDMCVRESRHSRDKVEALYAIGTRKWIAVTQVCYAWRSAALASLQLWSLVHINPVHYKWAGEMLKRCQTHPVTIHADFSDDKAKTSILKTFDLLTTDVRQKLPHLKELRLRRLPKRQLKIFFKGQLSLPELEMIGIACFPACEFDKDPFIFGDEWICAPRLKRVDLTGLFVKWDSQLLRGLTRLRLAWLPPGSTTLRDILVVLSKCPQLQYLALHNPYEGPPNDDEIGSFKAKKVKLPHLHTLQLLGDLDQISSFLRCVTVPPRCFRNWYRLDALWHERPDDPRPHYNTVLQHISNLSLSKSQGNDPEVPYIQSLRVAKSHFDEFNLQGFSELLSHEELNNLGLQPAIDLHFSWDDGDDDTLKPFDLETEGFLSLMKALPLQHVAVFEVSGDWDLEMPIWTVLLRRMPALIAILLDIPSRGFLSELKSDRKPCPELNSLFVRDLDVDDTDSVLLQDTLRTRASQGMPIQHVFLCCKNQQSFEAGEMVPTPTGALETVKVDLQSPVDYDVWGATAAVERDSDSDDDLDLYMSQIGS